VPGYVSGGGDDGGWSAVAAHPLAGEDGGGGGAPGAGLGQREAATFVAMAATDTWPAVPGGSIRLPWAFRCREKSTYGMAAAKHRSRPVAASVFTAGCGREATMRNVKHRRLRQQNSPAQAREDRHEPRPGAHRGAIRGRGRMALQHLRRAGPQPGRRRGEVLELRRASHHHRPAVHPDRRTRPNPPARGS